MIDLPPLPDRGVTLSYRGRPDWDSGAFTAAQMRQYAKLAIECAFLAQAAPVPEKLPQAEGADWFIVVDLEDGTSHFCYDAALGRSFGHEHIKDAMQEPELRDSAKRWVVRPAYAAPVPAEAPAMRDALAGLVAVIDAAGLENLFKGVQLGPTVWYVKASDAMAAAKAALKEPL